MNAKIFYGELLKCRASDIGASLRMLEISARRSVDYLDSASRVQEIADAYASGDRIRLALANAASNRMSGRKGAP